MQYGIMRGTIPLRKSIGGIMPLSQDDKDEIRELIAQEFRNAVKSSVSAVINAPIELADVGRFGSPELMQEREARKKIARDIGKVILESAEDGLREAQARVIEKTDPERAKIVRSFKPTY